MEEDISSGYGASSSASSSLSDLVRCVIKYVTEARDAEEVTEALHSLASLFHSYNLRGASGSSPSSLEIAQLASSCLEEASRISGNHEPMEVLKSMFYGSSLFPALTKILLYHVAPDWLACFSAEEQVNLFDSFFRLAPSTEAVLSLVPALTPSIADVDNGQIAERYTTCGVAERLLVLCLFEDGGLRKLVTQSATILKSGVFASGSQNDKSTIVRLIASIPDRVRPGAHSDLCSPHFHLSAVSNFLEAIEEYWESELGSANICKVPFVQAGDLFSRFCRRGHADVVASTMLSKLRGYIEQKGVIINRSGVHKSQMVVGILDDTSETCLQSSYWEVLMICMKDAHAIERLAKALLLEMAEKQIKDEEAYQILCILFSGLLENLSSVRSLFTERFLVWTVLPICCLKWILQFAVFKSPFEKESSDHTSKTNIGNSQRAVIQRLVEVWSGEKFIQAGEMQLQSYVTAAVGLSLRTITKEDLESTNNLLQSLLQGISRRLESPLDLVRIMAKKIALAFSLVIDKTKPLLLDENDKIEELCDWEAFDIHKKPGPIIAQHPDHNATVNNEINEVKVIKTNDDVIQKKKKDQSVSEAFDPDEIIDLRTYTFEDYDDDSLGGSDSESVCSIQPYSLSDDESDLQREKLPMQLTDCCANLRKGDQPDLVERTLDAVEKLIRAMPEELENIAPDLAHALIHVRCSDIVVEGQEDAAENRRFNALVALLACAPWTVEMFARELYSPHVDISQRLLVLEVMSDAARELSALGSMIGSSVKGSIQHGQHAIVEMDRTWYGPGSNFSPIGASPWRQIHEPNAMVNLIHKYEREVPYLQGEFKPLGKTRRWGHKSMELRAKHYKQSQYPSTGRNNFAPYASAFMLPLMRDYDKIQHGVDFLGRDFVVLGRLICMLGVCVECVSLQPEAVILASALLDMLRSRKISYHPETYVKRAILYAASRVMISLHPSHIMNSAEILGGLDWIRAWALKVMDEDSDTECSSMAMACLHIHSELILQASRSIEIQHKKNGADITYKLQNINITSIPYTHAK